MPATKPPIQTKRKRTRKRKRRAASSSSSSSSSDSSSSDNEKDNTTAPLPTLKATVPSSSDSESKSSSSSDSSDEEIARRRPRGPITVKETKDFEKLPSRHLSPSPSPPPAELPSFLPQKGADSPGHSQMKEQEMKSKFRQFWMSSVADGFRDDLEEIRKEPNLGTSRLALLIDSLASGADVFSSSSGDSGTNEMEVILG